jgi:hypothetical protein
MPMQARNALAASFGARFADHDLGPAERDEIKLRVDAFAVLVRQAAPISVPWCQRRSRSASVCRNNHSHGVSKARIVERLVAMRDPSNL